MTNSHFYARGNRFAKRRLPPVLFLHDRRTRVLIAIGNFLAQRDYDRVFRSYRLFLPTIAGAPFPQATP